ncbi:monovalent cation/H+ antiporter complex subunit F [Nocardia sp. BMG111209]|uniref:monovalent cation/H+ antiporter complex subunit F n=1 Tax=Nocardia sp. BMG111209 TaxID=1160137 RepID=UPI00036ADDF9|nr:monovalent cation/H+ antiporter complex subunit F [Nocardia sp. BMG111209]
MIQTGIWSVATAALLVGAVPPGALLAARGPAAHRLIGLQLIGSVVPLALVTLSLAVRRPDYLIVPLVLVLLSFAGTLVFTRLIDPSDDGPG